MWVHEVFIGLVEYRRATRSSAPPYPRNMSKPLPHLETLLMSEVRAYDVLRDRLLELVTLRPDGVPRRYRVALEVLKNQAFLRSKEWNAFVISPEPSTLKKLKVILSKTTGAGRYTRTVFPLLYIRVKKRRVNP